MENRTIGWEWISKIRVSVLLPYPSGLSLNMPLVAIARKKTLCCTAVWSNLVQLLRSSLLLQFLSSAQRGSRLLTYSRSTHVVLTVSMQHRRATGGERSMLDTKLENNYSAKYPTVQEQRFLPKVLSSKRGVWKAANVRNSRCPLVTASSVPEVVTCHPPRRVTGPAPVYTHLLTGIRHKRAVDAETWKHLFLLFQWVRLWEAVQKQFCKQKEREGRHFQWFLSCLPALITVIATNTQSFFSII